MISPLRVWIFFFAISIQLYFRFPEYRFYAFLFGFALHIIAVLGVINIRLNFFIKSFSAGKRDSKQIALTFDDGPDENITPEILDLLKENSIKATFFVIGKNVEKYPEILKRTFDEGHTIASHDLTHSNFSNFRFGKMIKNHLIRTNEIINNIINKKPALYRPPMGMTNPHYKKALKKLNMQSIGWNARGFDAGNRRISGIKRVSTLARSGGVILIHDTLPKPLYKQDILESIRKLIQDIKQKELTTVTIDKLFNITAYQGEIKNESSTI